MTKWSGRHTAAEPCTSVAHHNDRKDAIRRDVRPLRRELYKPILPLQFATRFMPTLTTLGSYMSHPGNNALRLEFD
jgi:hypothetical protein